MNLHWLFVYGTLRPRSEGGRPGHRMLQEAMVMPPFEDCIASGVMYHVVGSSRDWPYYPVVDFDEEGMVTGTLLLVRAGSFDAAHRMEVGAGYEPRMVAVEVPGWHERVLALAYHWPNEDRGPMVPSGDWHQERGL